MKNKIAILTALVSMLLITSCNDLITDIPESKLNQADYYNTPSHIQEGIMGCYSGMQQVIVNEWAFTENRTDNSCVANAGTGTTRRVDYCDIRFFRTPPSQPLLLTFWGDHFTNINNVNTLLPVLAKGQTIITSETLRAQYEAELLFIRAYHYFSLVNLWGDMFKVTSTLDKDQAKTLKRLPVDSIYAQVIMPDLKKAVAQLPSTYSYNDVGRITKWAAEGILAKAYLTRHSTNDLDSALVLINDILSNSPHALPLLSTGVLVAGKQLSPYASIFDISNEMNKEVIFAIRFKGGTSGIGSPFWSTFAPDGSGTTFITVGTPGGDNNATVDLLTVFATDTLASSVRYHSSILMYGKKATSLIGYPNKWVDLTISQVNQSENDWIVLRVADILLLRAEIYAQRGTGDLGLADVNLVRARAGVTQYTTTSFGKGTVALDNVYKERRLELAFEDTRWFDLLRMNKSYNDPDKALRILKNEVFASGSVLYPAYKPIITPSQEYYLTTKLLLPIPQREIDTYNSQNSLTLTQNPGY